MAKVIFSAGHSPVDKGAIIGDLVEYDLTTKIVDVLEPMLTEYKKLEPKRIPTGLSLPQKIQWINSSGYKSENNDIAVEVHINDADGTEDGIECWHAERGDNASKDLCTKVMNAISEETGMRKRSVRSEYDHQFRRLGYVHNTATISALLEVGFMDNPKDKKILTSDEGIKNIAKGFLKGILDYFGLKEGEFDKEPQAQASFPVHTDPDPKSQSGVMPGLGAFPAGFGQTGLPQMPGALPTAMPSMRPQTMPVSMPQTLGALPQASGPSISAPAMNPQEKKDMITRLYQKVLGRNPDQQGLQYYANSQMSEDALMRLMVESKEHKNIIKAARDYVSAKTLLSKREREITELKAKLSDKEQEVQSLSQYFQKVQEAVTETPEIESVIPQNGEYEEGNHITQRKMSNSLNISKTKANEVRRLKIPGAFRVSEALQFAKGLIKRKK